MTSNLAADEIAQHGLKLRREQEARQLKRTRIATPALAGYDLRSQRF